MSISNGIVNSITAALARSLSGLVYVYDFNGVNNAVETYRPIIPDTTTDDFTQSVTLYGPVPTDGVLFAKNLSATDVNKELEVSLSSSEIKVIVGGTTTLTSVNVTTAGVYIFSFDDDLVITRNGVEIYNAALTRGSATEPTATMTYAAGHNGTLTTYTDYYAGVMRNCLTEPVSPSSFDSVNLKIDDNSQFLTDSLANEQPELWTYDNPVNVNSSAAFENLAGEFTDANITFPQAYRVKFINNCTSSVNLRIGSETVSAGSGESADEIVYSTSNTRNYLQSTTASTIGTINNISVKKATSAEIKQHDPANWSQINA